MIPAHIAQYIHGLHAVTVIVNQQQVRTAQGEVCTLDTLSATQLGGHFSLLTLAQCIIDMHHDFDLMKVARDVLLVRNVNWISSCHNP